MGVSAVYGGHVHTRRLPRRLLPSPADIIAIAPAGQVVVVLEPYSEKIGQKIKIDILPLSCTVLQGRDQERSGDLPGSSDASILRNNCVIDREEQSHDAYTICQAHFPQPLATIRRDKQIARIVADLRKLKSMSQSQDEYENYELLLAYMQLFPYATIVYLVQKLRPDGQMSFVPLINTSNHFFDHDLHSRNDFRFVRRIPREHAIFHMSPCDGPRRILNCNVYNSGNDGSPDKCDASANESRGCGQKGPRRIFNYEPHRIIKVEHKCLAQALKLVKELKTLELQESFFGS